MTTLKDLFLDELADMHGAKLRQWQGGCPRPKKDRRRPVYRSPNENLGHSKDR